MSCCFGSSSPPSGSDNPKDLLKKIKVLEEKLGETEKKLREAERQRDAAQQEAERLRMNSNKEDTRGVLKGEMDNLKRNNMTGLSSFLCMVSSGSRSRASRNPRNPRKIKINFACRLVGLPRASPPPPS